VSGGTLWLMSTPYGKRGFFYETWERGGAEWERVRVPADECPRIPKAFLEEERRAMGDRWYRQEYLCEFVDSVSGMFDRDAVEKAITRETVAILVEAIQGEGGIVIPPAGWLRRLREIASADRVLLILDEIQSGLGRTGRLFCYEHEGIRPDVVIIGKALGGGCVPVSGILADDEVMDVFKPGDHGSTFGGNPLACAVAHAALRALLDEGMIENAARLGTYFTDRLRAIKSRHVKEIRGKGLWIGVELTPEAGGARRFCEELQRQGLLCKETHVNIIRFAPPLVITREEIDWALERITKVLS